MYRDFTHLSLHTVKIVSTCVRCCHLSAQLSIITTLAAISRHMHFISLCKLGLNQQPLIFHEIFIILMSSHKIQHNWTLECMLSLGIEPTTSGLPDQCSINWSTLAHGLCFYSNSIIFVMLHNRNKWLVKNTASGESCTHYLSFTRQVL